MSEINLNDDELNKEFAKLLEEIKNFKPDGENDVLDELKNNIGFDLNDFEDFLSNGLSRKILAYKKLNEDAIDPEYAYDSDSGFDLFSTEEVKLVGFERKLVPTGLSFDIPEGYEIQVRTKSGLAINQGLIVLNSPGTVDQGYTGEVKVIMMNMNNLPVTINKGQKIAQAVLCPVESGKKVFLHQVEEFVQKERGSNGFGSTGI